MQTAITPTVRPENLPASASLEDLAEQATAFARATRSKATLRAYANDQADFLAWCNQQGLSALPAAPATVGLYLTDRSRTHAVATLARRLSAISIAHRLAGYHIDSRHPAIADVLRGIRRAKGIHQRQAKPTKIDLIQRMVSDCGESLRDKRDSALLLIGFAAALRRSELVALDIADITFSSEGVRLYIRRSKTDQEGAGSVVGIVRTGTATCPVRAIQAWLDAAKITEGRIFRRVDRHNRIGAMLTDQSVALIVKRRATQLGYDAAQYSGHSLRAGFATTAADNGVEELMIARQTRHRSMTVLRTYIREANLLGVRNASGRVGL